ncbi:phospholipase A2 group XV-like [Planococcus citri]|uniref:phospholipase A2 group XV-like n=1 Tax=Planococcus citri TaxID=170843 RepID=UPI0031F9E1ED
MVSKRDTFYCILCCYIVHAVNGLYPVVLVPGDGGSQMEAKLDKPAVVHYVCDKKTTDYFSLWLNMELLVPVVIDCLIDNMKLTYNNETRTTSNSPGVSVRIPAFGNSTTVEYIDPSRASAGSYFKDIANMLVNMGYERNTTLRGAPYDFRKGPNEQSEYFEALKNLIVETYELNGQKPVILIVHSLGGLMTLAMLHKQDQKWKDKYIKLLVSLAGAWGGSTKAVKVFAIGDDLGVYVLQGSVLRAEQITSPSLAWLLPSPYLWKPDEVFVETDSKNYSLNNLQEFFNDINYPVGWEMYKDVHPFIDNFEAPGVEVHCLYGYGIPTVEKLVYAKGKFPNGSPSLMSGDGDGTVNKRSLRACTYWTGLQKQRIYEVGFPGVDHMAVLRSVNTIEYIKQLVERLK